MMDRRIVIDVEYLPAEGADPAGYLATCEAIGLVVDGDDLDHLVGRVKALLPDLLAEQRGGALPKPVTKAGRLWGTESASGSVIFELRHVLSDGDGLLQGTA